MEVNAPKKMFLPEKSWKFHSEHYTENELINLVDNIGKITKPLTKKNFIIEIFKDEEKPFQKVRSLNLEESLETVFYNKLLLIASLEAVSDSDFIAYDSENSVSRKFILSNIVEYSQITNPLKLTSKISKIELYNSGIITLEPWFLLHYGKDAKKYMENLYEDKSFKMTIKKLRRNIKFNF
ncbi:MAG: hypothetical protein KC589_08740 [Nanoarchaeota archaeon]|nr:hypothetical protein [Nanoarchaeota archaeon]MCA9497007.1 hypothetical protein [Nanoarchaeota archaeon]